MDDVAPLQDTRPDETITQGKRYEPKELSFFKYKAGEGELQGESGAQSVQCAWKAFRRVKNVDYSLCASINFMLNA